MKKTLFKWLMALVAVVSVSAMQSCKDDGPDDNGGGLGKYDFTIAEDDLYQSVNKDGGQIEIDILTSLPKTQWTVEYDANWLMAMQGSTINGHATLTINVQSNSESRREATVKVSSLTRNYNITIRQYGANGVEAEEDFPVKPTGATASSEQPGSGEIKYSYDDDPETMYHSHWTNTRMPVTLEYYFSGQESIDYIDYVPRMGGGNGAFGQLSVEVATNASRSNYQAIGDFDFQEQATTSRINLPESMKATGVKFIVKSGTGGFASCAEMKFWRRNTDRKLDKELLTVFTDLTCTELKPGVGPEEIGALSNEFFQDLAEIIRTDSYDPIEKLIRIHEYEPYSNPVEWAEKLMTKIYSNLDNPMGIHVTKGQTMILCVGPTHGHNVSVMCVGEHKASGGDDYAIPEASGPSYMLTEGVNVLTMTSDGQLFLMYTADPSEPKIKVHVPVGDNGRLAGYFDLKEHKT
ncbi:MAG: discoidin domain-containing protein, partial [Muribaculaceae bacterium]|nr:discoidin domain-containing protein [Muribaculaceae bacterium]